jgi:hypothetical protein
MLRQLLYLFLAFSSLSSLSAQSGECTNGDCENGKGRYIYPNGDKYIGEFKDSKLDGRGVYTFKNGNVYRGQFKNNMRHGYGTYHWISGDTYIGEYENNKRQGQGAYKWKNGDLYEGSFINNMREGEGKLTYADGRVQEGIWKGDVFLKPFEEPVIEKVDSADVHDPFASAANEDLNALRAKRMPPLVDIADGKARTALVIGNNEYGKASLKNPVNDAIAMAEELQRSGFEVILFTNAKQKDIKMAIRDFGQLLKEKGGVGLFFYAGHGLQADGRNYIVPVNADIQKSMDIEFESVDLGRVLVEMDYAENDLNIVILDACRDNPYKEEFKNSRNKHNGFASIHSAPYNSFIAFSTSPGAVAMDNPDAEHGLYTEQLLKQMRQEGLKIEDIFKKVRSYVRKASDGKQIPWEISSVEDDFYFKP